MEGIHLIEELRLEIDTSQSMDIFGDMLRAWPGQWDACPSYVRATYGLGYRSELAKETGSEVEVYSGTIVEGTAPYDRQTAPGGVSKPSPRDMPRVAKRPELRLEARRPQKELPAR